MSSTSRYPFRAVQGLWPATLVVEGQFFNDIGPQAVIVGIDAGHRDFLEPRDRGAGVEERPALELEIRFRQFSVVGPLDLLTDRFKERGGQIAVVPDVTDESNRRGVGPAQGIDSLPGTRRVELGDFPGVERAESIPKGAERIGRYRETV
jgi:hypothetical protein